MFPVVYSTVRWDHSSIFVILKHWFTRMEDVHINDTIHVDNDVRAKELRLCINLLDRLIKDEYYEHAHYEHNKKWGETVLNFNAKEGESILSRPNVKTEEDRQQERKEYRKGMEREEYLYQQDINLLFDTIKKRHRGWWT